MNTHEVTPEDGPQLVRRWRDQSDQSAASELFERYAARLIALVRTHTAEKLVRRFDAEDVVQSAFRSFFIGSREGRYLLQHSDNLWRLLVSISLHKLHHGIDRHLAQRRSVDREDATGVDEQWCRLFQYDLLKRPTPDEAMFVADELQSILSGLGHLEQRMLELRLEGYTLDEIAQDCSRSQRTVRRVMDRIKRDCEERHVAARGANP